MKIFKALPTIFKSIFYQANWNIDNMQGTGFAWLLRDLFKRFNINDSNFKQKTRADYFNTNPYFITFMLGIVLKEAESNTVTDSYKSTYASVFGALGDTFFWHSLRPLAFFLSIGIATYKPIFAIILYLIIFNTFHIGFKFLGFYLGYHYGSNVIDIFRKVSFNRWSYYIDHVSAFIMGVTLSFLLIKQPDVSTEFIIKSAIFFLVGYSISRFIKAPEGLMIASIATILLIAIGV